jgi:hypothetical protein
LKTPRPLQRKVLWQSVPVLLLWHQESMKRYLSTAKLLRRMTVILLGSAFMITQLRNRKSTQDIDIVIATNDAATYQAFQQAAGLVAKERKLSPAWLNDDVAIVVDQIGKPRAPKLWKTFSNLTVYLPEFEYVLALKLFSGRSQDDQDIKALAQQLQVRTKEQAWAIVHSYIPDMQLDMRRSYTTQAIDRCFVT